MTLLRPLRKFTVHEYHKMAKAGILREGERVELLEGVIVEMTPTGGPHIGATYALMGLLHDLVAKRAIVSVQSPIRLGESSEPEPDLAIIRLREDAYRKGPALAEDALLVVEVADTSLLSDSRDKVPMYARAGIPEFWLVNIPRGRVEVLRSPVDGDYTERSEIERGGSVSPQAFPDIVIAVTDILG